MVYYTILMKFMNKNRIPRKFKKILLKQFSKEFVNYVTKHIRKHKTILTKDGKQYRYNRSFVNL